eukprot:351609-Chlamydomonas_euryale.AAC.6
MSQFHYGEVQRERSQFRYARGKARGAGGWPGCMLSSHCLASMAAKQGHCAGRQMGNPCAHNFPVAPHFPGAQPNFPHVRNFSSAPNFPRAHNSSGAPNYLHARNSFGASNSSCAPTPR